MSSRTRKYVVVIALSVAVVVIVSALHLSLSVEKESSYMTMYEFYHHAEYHYWELNGEFREGLRFNIRDKVLNSTSVEFPTLVVGSGQGNISYDLLNATVLTFVQFESMDNLSSGFLGNATDEYQPGEQVEFILETREYSAPWYYGMENPNRILVEPVFVDLLLSTYSFLLASNEYTIADVETELINNSTELQVTIEYVGDFYPMPFTWANVTVTMCQELLCEQIDVQPTVELYDKDSSLLGILDSTSPNSSIYADIEPGQYLLVSYDLQHSSHFLLFEAVFTENGAKKPWTHLEVP